MAMATGSTLASSAVADAAGDLAGAAGSARGWVRETAADSARIKSESPALIDLSRRVENAARKLGNAAARRMCVGIFGPSQAGKSYLVSRLCKKPASAGGADERLVADIGGRAMDFLREINPPGDKESTGLVTRFTKIAVPTPDGYPVSLRLLGETDLVRIFANSFLLDFDANNLSFDPPGEPETHALLTELRKTAKAPPLLHLGELSIFDLKEYLARNFSKRLTFLEPAGYWDFALAHAAELSIADRARLFSVLWGGIEEFTALFVRLVQALEAIGYPAEANAAIEALTPRERSIIDVDRIKLELGTEADEADCVPVKGAKTAELPRAVLCALVAELRIAMRNETWPLFDQVDLLDFPGARSREKYRSIAERAEDDDDLARRPRELFIRGKVAVLFQRYSEEREITAMLLCMAGSNAEVKDLGPLVRDWIWSTHGETPAERQRQRNALFFVLTKSDADFVTKEGEDEDSRRGKWYRRVYASMIELYQRDGWLDDWDGKPFRNTLWLRNPGIEQTHLVSYATEDRGGTRVRVEPLTETGYAPDIAGRLPEIREHLLADERVTRYFEDAPAAYDALLALNDGGVSYIVEKIAQVSDPRVKDGQVRGRLLAQAHHLTDGFQRFYDAGASGSREEKLQKAKKAAEAAGKAIFADEFRSAGRLLDALSAQEDELRGLYFTVASMAGEETQALTPAAGGSIFDDFEETPHASTGASEGDRSEAFAERAVQHWIRRVREFAADQTHPLRRKIDSDTADLLVQELIAATMRRGVAGKIAAEVRRQVSIGSADWENASARAACVAANAINEVVTGFGYTALPPDARPPVPPLPEPARRRAFAPPPGFDGMPALAERPMRLARDFTQDWLAALVQAAIDNMGVATAREISEAQNAVLGQILDRAHIESRLEQA
ncbi:virulence factor SrfC family protein [Falsiroseomonas sp.]|uniref:virulence factor SrfC family protein n=1 Tax=Falsiroseomonas sp. TaxID=2870721 RepID=UPI00271EC309|nr:virulence factor SrfC family protein [Falsiroseomonas sp.]MDO9500962.1 virulence factor SrfC family protein [Falsiroseomonas sp.]